MINPNNLHIWTERFTVRSRGLKVYRTEFEMSAGVSSTRPRMRLLMESVCSSAGSGCIKRPYVSGSGSRWDDELLSWSDALPMGMLFWAIICMVVWVLMHV
jgi:hypothetical protein